MGKEIGSGLAVKLKVIYKQLLAMYGWQAWWPAESPFEVMLGAILTQNTNWSHVEKALVNLKQRGAMTPEILLSLSDEDLENCLRPAGYFRIKTRRLQSYCRWYLLHGGYAALQMLSTLELRVLLLDVTGIGPETADDILLYAFERPVFVVDAYTRRLLGRLHLIQGREKYEELRWLFESNLPRDSFLYQQYHALMVIHAKQRCRKNKPECQACQLAGNCFYSVSS